MLGDRSRAITITKAETTDLVDLSDFIKPFVDSGEILPRTYDELEYLLETFFIARLDGRLVWLRGAGDLQQETLRNSQLGGGPKRGKVWASGRAWYPPASTWRRAKAFMRLWRSARRKTSSSPAASISRCPT